MIRRIGSLIAIVLIGSGSMQFSCTTMFGTALRDAAIGGAAGFVEGTITELLNGWFDRAFQE